MIKIIVQQFFHALNTRNEKHLDYLIDQNCLLLYDNAPTLGNTKVIYDLIHILTSHQITQVKLINQVVDQADTVLISFQLVNSTKQNYYGSLVLRINPKQKITYLKVFIIK